MQVSLCKSESSLGSFRSLVAIAVAVFAVAVIAPVGRIYSQEKAEAASGVHEKTAKSDPVTAEKHSEEKHAASTEQHSADGHKTDTHSGAGTDGHKKTAESEHGGVDYNQPPLSPDIPLLIFSILLFAGFYFLGRKVAWEPMISGLNTRESRVKQAYADASFARDEAARLLAEHEAKMKETYEKVRGIVAQARQEAEQAKTEVLAKAEVEARELKDKAIAEIDAARKDALGSLTRSMDGYVSSATEHLIGRRIGQG